MPVNDAFHIYDTTLRDGAQQEGLNLSVHDKLNIARHLDDLGVGFIEGGWPGANPKDTEFFALAKKELKLKNATFVAFGATRRPNAKAADDVLLGALRDSGAPAVTLVAKAFDRHVELALKTTLDENLEMIRDSVKHLREEGQRVFLDAEHFFDGYRSNRAYALAVVRVAAEAGADVIALCDTNGGMLPDELSQVVHDVLTASSARLGIHCHNDTGCAVANSMAAVAAGATHVQGTLNVCEVARAKSIPVIFSSSSSVYGANTRDKKVENEWLSPLSPYAASKLSGEATVVAFSRSFGIQTAVFRLFNVYGPGQRPEHQYSAVIPKWIWAALREEELRIFGDGRTSRDFTYIDNVVEILSRCVLEDRYFDGVTNLAFGNPVTLLDVIEQISKIVPKLEINHYETRPGDIRNSDNGSTRLRDLFPEVRPTTLGDGIDSTLKWLKSARNEIEAHPLMVSDD